MVGDLEVFAQARLVDHIIIIIKRQIPVQICSVEAGTVVVVEIDSWMVVASPKMVFEMGQAYSICLMMDCWAGDLEVGQDQGRRRQAKQA